MSDVPPFGSDQPYPPPPPGGYPPPPPPGGYPPPPPPGGYPPPPPGYGEPGGGFTPGASPIWQGPPLAEWTQRVLARLADMAIALVALIPLYIVGLILGAIVRPLGLLWLIVSYLALLAYGILQLVKEGNTGQTIGKKIVGVRVLKEETGQPVGPGMAIVRQIAHFVDGICCVGYLFPLFDAKKQTFADKIMGTVVISVPKQPFNSEDLYTFDR